MNSCKEIKYYIKNNELDLEKIINEYSSYTATIIDNMARNSLNDEDKEEIVSVRIHTPKFVPIKKK